MKKLILTGLTAMALSVSASAASVTGYSAPTANTPANAAEVDANFQALITAINDNAAQIDALNNQVAALENSSVSDRTYAFEQLLFILGAQKAVDPAQSPESQESGPSGGSSVQQGFARIGMYKASHTLAFAGDGTLTLTLDGSEVEFWVNSDSDIGLTITDTGSVTGTWSQTGNIVTVNLPGGDVFDVTVANGGGAITIRDALIGGFDTDNGCNGDGTVCSYEYETSINFGLETTQ
ncbi:hypothetical protein [Marinobacter halotolerans]|uniref:hypothetical protein n=1 Tax=Marinobacter halotolerans TaxID=1569211 RepID=UPI001245950C|nr:hypothetical protein [Marinobacter halotolerans]